MPAVSKLTVFKTVPWFTHPNAGEVTTVVRVPAKNEQEALRKVRGWYNKQEYPPKDLVFLSCEPVKSLNEYALDILWESNPDLYLSLWEPGMKTTTILSKLKAKHPEIWEGLMLWDL